MTRLVRLAIALLILAGVALIVGLLPAIMAPRPVRAAPPPANDPNTPTSEFSATLRLAASRPVVAVGQTVRLTADLSVVEGCIYAVMELTVAEDSDAELLFAHADPTDDTILPEGFPSVWAFRALHPGTAEFAAHTFGEGNCDGAWFWRDENARSGSVQVLDLPYRLWLPTVSQP